MWMKVERRKKKWQYRRRVENTYALERVEKA